MKRASASCGRERVREVLRAMLALVCATWLAALPARTEERTACPLEPGPTRAVTGVIDAETLVLDDGSEVRLIGALAPRPPDAVLDVSYWPPERDAKAALEKLVLGHSVTLAFSGRRADRYGRMLAHVFLEPDVAGDREWLQARMLAEGHARAFVVKDSLGCLRELAAHEAIARRAGVGLWSHAAYQIREASRTQDLTRLRSTFQLVEGEVTKVIVGKTAVILRFGHEDEAAAEQSQDEAKRPARGFSISVRTAIAHSWSAGEMTLERTAGRRLRIRGWIERRGGPAIEILDAHQIELVEDGQGSALATTAAEPPPPPPRRSRRAKRETAAVVLPVHE